MKMKKFISAIAAVAMLSASLVSVSAAGVVFADKTMGTKTFKAVQSMPTKEEVAQRDVKFSAEAKLLTYDEVATETGAFDEIFQYMIDGLDVYRITATYSNLGELVNGRNYDAPAKYSTIGARAWEFNILGDAVNEIQMYTINGAQFEAGTAKQAVVDGKFNNFYQATDTANPYPTYSGMVDASYVENGEVTLVTYVAVNAGAEITLTPDDYEATFMYTVGADAQYASFTKPTIVFGATAPVEPDEPEVPVEEIVVAPFTPEEGLSFGFAWDVTINNYDSAKTYTATFTAAGYEPKVNDLTIEAETGATVNFAALLKTAKTAVELAIAKN